MEVQDRWRVARTPIGNHVISTCDLTCGGLVHSTLNVAPFETLVFDASNNVVEGTRYTTREEAEYGHERYVMDYIDKLGAK